MYTKRPVISSENEDMTGQSYLLWRDIIRLVHREYNIDVGSRVVIT